jgi:hypothetical protein
MIVDIGLIAAACVHWDGSRRCPSKRGEATGYSHSSRPYPVQGVFRLCARFDFEHDDIQHNLFSGEWMIEVDHC